MIKKYFGIIVTTVFLFLFVYYLIEEPKFLEILSTTKPSIIFAILSLSFFRICLISVQNIFLFRILNINLTFKEAFKISCLMIVGGFQAIMHAICPAVFTTSASDKIKILYDKVSKR